jgi:hypothetical protein
MIILEVGMESDNQRIAAHHLSRCLYHPQSRTLENKVISNIDVLIHFFRLSPPNIATQSNPHLRGLGITGWGVLAFSICQEGGMRNQLEKLQPA